MGARIPAGLRARVIAALVALIVGSTALLSCSLVIPDELAFLFETPTPRVIVREVTVAVPPTAAPTEAAPTVAPPATPSPAPTQTPVVIVVTATPAPEQPFAAAPAVAPTVIRDVEEEIVTAIYRRVSPSVVFITSEFYYYDRFWGEQTQSASGSGFIVDTQGHIVTNNHVVQGATHVDVKLYDGTTVSATIVGTDPEDDLAVLRIDVPAERLIPVELGDSDALSVGQRAIAIGSPLGLEQSLSVGVISALGRELVRGDNERTLFNVVQTDAAINQGNSGGPLLDSQGRVIAVNTAIPNVTGASIGIGFAVPVNTIKRVLPELIATGRYRHAWIGIGGYGITPGLADLLDLPVEQGIVVMRLDKGGPADQGGVRGPTHEVAILGRRIPVGGDIITAIDGEPLTDVDGLVRFLAIKGQVGQEVTLEVIRGQETLNLTVRLGDLEDGS